MLSLDLKEIFYQMLRCRLFLFFCSNSLEKNGSGRWELGWSRWAKRGTEEKTETTTRCWGHPTRPHRGAHPARAVPSGTRRRAQALHVPLLLCSQTPAQHRGRALPKIAPREGQPTAAQLGQERDATGVWTVLTSHADASVILSDCI